MICDDSREYLNVYVFIIQLDHRSSIDHGGAVNLPDGEDSERNAR
jgi:hypothetical protein